MRLTVTRKSDLAIRAVQALAADPGCVPGDTLAASLGTTRGFLVQVMAPLVRARWVRSTPGPQGGYQLRHPTTALTVKDVIEAIEGPLESARCVLDSDRTCVEATSGPTPGCALHEPWLATRAALVADLARRPLVPASSRRTDD